MRTQVAAGTLRQWERRYGIPQPERSEGGFRLFSEDDIERIKAMKRHLGNGVLASRAAELVKRDYISRLSGSNSTEVLRQALVNAFLEVDEAKAHQLLSQAYALHPLARVLTDIMQGSIVALGELWHEGKIDIATEHFASNVIQAKLRALLTLTAPVQTGHGVVIACAPLEQHELGPLIIAVLLRQSGSHVVYLGADTPLKDLREMAQKIKPTVVLISATTSQSLARLIENKNELAGVAPHLIFGGLAFRDKPDTAEMLGGYLLSGTAEQNVLHLKALLGGN